MFISAYLLVRPELCISRDLPPGCVVHNSDQLHQVADEVPNSLRPSLRHSINGASQDPCPVRTNEARWAPGHLVSRLFRIDVPGPALRILVLIVTSGWPYEIAIDVDFFLRQVNKSSEFELLRVASSCCFHNSSLPGGRTTDVLCSRHCLELHSPSFSSVLVLSLSSPPGCMSDHHACALCSPRPSSRTRSRLISTRTDDSRFPLFLFHFFHSIPLGSCFPPCQRPWWAT